jgi:hypothetical protein
MNTEYVKLEALTAADYLEYYLMWCDTVAEVQ